MLEAELVSAIYAAPDDDAPRLVYADWLQERGDPRGELIALQLAGMDASALLAEHGARWLGDLRATDVRWERGFVAACRPLLDADPHDPRWRTVVSFAGTSILRDEVELPALRELRDLGNHDLERLGALTRPLAVTAIAWNAVPPGTAWVTRILDELAILPALRRLELTDARSRWHASGVAPVLAPACFAGIEELATFADLSYLHEWCALDTPLQRIGLVEDGLRVVLSRDATRRFSQLEITAAPAQPATRFRSLGEGLLAGLGALPRTQLTRVRTSVPPELHERIADRVRGQVRLAGVER